MELTKKQQAAEQLFDALKETFLMMRFDSEDRQATRVIVPIDGDDDCLLGSKIEEALSAAGYDFADFENHEAEMAPEAPVRPAGTGDGGTVL